MRAKPIPVSRWIGALDWDGLMGGRVKPRLATRRCLRQLFEFAPRRDRCPGSSTPGRRVALE